jgi:hypothetical protein
VRDAAWQPTVPRGAARNRPASLLPSRVAQLLSRVSAMKNTSVAWMLSCALLVPAGLSAQSNERLADKDVIGIIEAVDQARDRFEDQLDGKIKDSTIRTPNGEVRVEAALQDLEQMAKYSKTVKSRAADAKPATAEARQVVALTEKIGTFLQGKPTQPATLTAWGETRKSLLVLEQAYNIKP